MADRAESLRMLNDAHQFPGPYMFKIIGANTPEFVAQIIQAVVVVMGPMAQPNVSIRESAKGRHQAVTLSVGVKDAETVLDLYAAFRCVSGVRFLF